MVTSLLSEAGMESGEASIGSRLISHKLFALAAELKQQLEDGVIDKAEMRRQHRMILELAQQARAAEQAANLAASASNKISIVERRIRAAIRSGGNVLRALFLNRHERSDMEKERAAGLVILSDFQVDEDAVLDGPGGGKAA